MIKKQSTLADYEVLPKEEQMQIEDYESSRAEHQEKTTKVRCYKCKIIYRANPILRWACPNCGSSYLQFRVGPML